MRAPRSAVAGSLAVLLAILSASAGSPGRPPAAGPLAPAAAVSWPPSSGLLVAEVVTGGSSASDEYVEITNAGPEPLDLAGARDGLRDRFGSDGHAEASWATSLLVEPGRLVLIANALGIHAAGADATYSGGIAATGGRHRAASDRRAGPRRGRLGRRVERVRRGCRGAGAASRQLDRAPARRRGGQRGSTRTTTRPIDRDGRAGSAAARGPAGPGVGPEPHADTSASRRRPRHPPLYLRRHRRRLRARVPRRRRCRARVPRRHRARRRRQPRRRHRARRRRQPDADTEPDADGSPDADTEPDAGTHARAQPHPGIPIVAARSAVDGTRVVVEGVLTPRSVPSRKVAAASLPDATAGIALLLPADPTAVVAAGTLIRAAGTVDDRYGQRTIRLDGAPTALGTGTLPPALQIATGVAGESLEGRLVGAEGQIVEAPTQLASSISLVIDDGTGQLRVILAFAGAAAPARDQEVRVADRSASATRPPRDDRLPTGRDRSGRVSRSCRPRRRRQRPRRPPPRRPPRCRRRPPSRRPRRPPPRTPSPSPAPTPHRGRRSRIAAARAAGRTAAWPGREPSPPRQVAWGGAPHRHPGCDGRDHRPPCRTARPRRPVGTLLRVSGKLAEPYGQLEIRPGSRDIAPLGVLPVPDPLPVVASSLGEASEGRLVAIEGRLDGPIVRDSNGDLSLALIDATGAPFRARAARGAGIGADVARAGARLRVSGVVGHAGDRKGALDG